ncbi:MAG: 5-(carboxyamino)imidazole ribonucleotide synthase [Pseudomonadota bacterium]
MKDVFPPLKPGATIGILGSGQLGRMLAIAAAKLGYRTHIYADVSGPAFDVASETTIAPYENLGRMTAFAQAVDVVTYEFENVPLGAAAAALTGAPVRPSPRALEVAQDRIIEKRFIDGLAIAVPAFAQIDSGTDLKAALTTIGTPGILKTCRFGYDGKGQSRIMSADGADWALEAIGGAPAILEAVVPFDCEISVICARAADGSFVTYDCPLNIHRDGILHTSTVPSGLPEPILDSARQIAKEIAEALDYIGVLTVELFIIASTGATPSRLLVNEIAPRVHNSGHWTLEACAISHFDNHIRAITGLPLGNTQRTADATMTNLIGHAITDVGPYMSQPGASVHNYGKNEARPGRKMGHVTQLHLPEPKQ